MKNLNMKRSKRLTGMVCMMLSIFLLTMPLLGMVAIVIRKFSSNTCPWSGFADLLANLIEKYADELDIDNLPEPPKIKRSKEFNALKRETVENQKAA